MSALRCTRSGSTVYIKVELPGVQTFDFRFDTLNEWSAELLARAVQERLGSCAEHVREDSYTAGWKDAKAKRTKRRHFDTVWWDAMKHAFTVDTPTGKACSICGLAQRENDLVPRCESMPHWGRHHWAPGDGAGLLAAELVGPDGAARAARALPVTTASFRRALRAGGTP